MADALRSGRSEGDLMWVQVPPSAPLRDRYCVRQYRFFLFISCKIVQFFRLYKRLPTEGVFFIDPFYVKGEDRRFAIGKLLLEDASSGLRLDM
jgi:hypothetical protein